MNAVLVTVARVEGSGPREPGTHMLVGRDEVNGTVGGGHLELRAIDIARTMAATGRTRHLERFALGPSLGQCCGGVVYLAFELGVELEERPLEDRWRVVALDGDGPAPPFDRTRGTHLMQAPDGSRWLIDAIRAPRNHLVLFGAGHVGAAIVKALAELPCTVTWVDEREDMFPPEVPANVTVEASDTPEALVGDAPPNAWYLVMTHSHALDQRLTEAIMARSDVAWFGLIGSHTKRMQFEHRLRARGVPQDRIAAMVCPIGLPGITNKAPAVIAASVCAQLLLAWETHAGIQQGF